MHFLLAAFTVALFHATLILGFCGLMCLEIFRTSVIYKNTEIVVYYIVCILVMFLPGLGVHWMLGCSFESSGSSWKSSMSRSSKQ